MADAAFGHFEMDIWDFLVAEKKFKMSAEDA